METEDTPATGTLGDYGAPAKEKVAKIDAFASKLAGHYFHYFE